MDIKDDGFTLVEALVSLIILAVAGLFFFQLVATSLTASASAERHEAALTVAKSRLAEMGISRPLQAGVQQGTANGTMRWQLIVRPHSNQLQTGISLYWVTARVSWQNERRAKREMIELTTLKPQLAK